ncbi:MAG: plasmid partitioning protein RepB [Alphaproteobacteria bacterium]|nr:plasmid partitioning protein RepB [Alphaproteobacteria bacterium]
MSKRTDTIKSLFTVTPKIVLSEDAHLPSTARVSAGAVRSLRESFSDAERENQELRQKLAAASLIIEIDPAAIDPSPLSDRFRDDDASAYETLKQSIRQSGQEVPVLVREHPTVPERYQCAYGHRRIRVASELGIKVKAIVRTLTDEALVVAQGLENAPRQDLTFIERAIFAMRIEDAGHKRAIVQDALAIDRAEASKLIAVARAIPPEIIETIGRAPKIGRGRWQSLADLFADPQVLDRVRRAINEKTISARDSNARFLLALGAATKPKTSQPKSRPAALPVLAIDGQEIGQVLHSDHEFRLSLDRNVPAGFADFLVEELPRLFKDFSEFEIAREIEKQL